MRGAEFLEAARRRKESIQVKTEHRDLFKFSLDQEWYGIDIENVVEVRECPRIFNIPHTPDHVVGVINLRGEILSIVDIRKLLGLSTAALESSPHTRGAKDSESAGQKHIVVIERNDVRVGIIVDRASGVVRVPDSAISSSVSGPNTAGGLIAGEVQLMMFSIGLEFQRDLDSKNISERLLQEFGNKGISLSDKAVISIEETGRRWLITDVRRMYSIRREEDGLNIYSGEVLAVLDLDPLMEET
jgi:chemotaxis signal transduction protein